MKAPPNNSRVPQVEPDPVAHAQAPQASGGASPGVAAPGNTATHGCNEQQNTVREPLKVFWQGLDTLELSYQGKITEATDAQLAGLKNLAQSDDPRLQAGAQLQVGPRVFEVADRGGGKLFAYLLRHPDIRIAVSSYKARRVPLAKVVFQNEYLVSVGSVRAAAEARVILEQLGELDGAETVSRCDLAVDLGTDIDIGSWHAHAWITHAEKIDPHYVNQVFTGWSIGLGGIISLRLYEKLLEIQTKSGKTYFFKLWEGAGWFHGDPVRRLELQFRRQVLREFGLRTVSDVLAAQPGLWAYGTRTWTRLTIPRDGDESRSRWLIHSFWEQVQAIMWDGNVRTLSRLRPKTGAPKRRLRG